MFYFQASSMANPVAAEDETEAVYGNSEALENEEMFRNSEVLASGEMHHNTKVLEKPPVPARPPVLMPKPISATLARSNNHNLPKPPVPV
jgi:hypothetical protein